MMKKKERRNKKNEINDPKVTRCYDATLNKKNIIGFFVLNRKIIRNIRHKVHVRM